MTDQPPHPSTGESETTDKDGDGDSSKGEQTPKAELPPLLMSSSSASGSQQGTLRKRDLERSSSWKKRHASLDAPPYLPSTHSPYFPSFTTNQPPPPSPAVDRPDRATRPEPCRRLDSSPASIRSSSSGCYISAPKSPPAHYPTASLQQQLSMAMSGDNVSPKDASGPPTLMSSSASTSSSSLSSSASSFQTPPDSYQDSRWTSPAMPHRSGSFGTATACPDVLVAEDVEEIIKGEDARVTVHTRKEVYEVWASLPGFEHENITVSTKQARTLHIVADNWDQGDHAQWDIKLGDDAQMSSIRAIFKGNYLNVTIPRRTATSASNRSTNSHATNTSGKSDRDRDLLGQLKERELEQQSKKQQREQASWIQACARAKCSTGWDAEREKREMEAKMGGLFCWGKSKDGAAG